MTGMVSVGTAARQFDLAVSTLHYWERRGIIAAHRRSGRRWFDGDQLYRIALIKLWQQTGLMSLDEIREIFEKSDRTQWHTVVQGRIAAVEQQIDRLTNARDYLRHLLRCRADAGPEFCPEFRATVDLPEELAND